jgi:RNA polymerase primary sigma factor
LRNKSTALLADEAPIFEMDELRQLIADGQEKGVLTIDQITAALEEVEVSKEQVTELHSYLVDQGIEVVTADGKIATSENGKMEAAAEARASQQPDSMEPTIGVKEEPELD